MSSEFEHKLQAMSEKFRSELPSRYEVIKQLFDDVVVNGNISKCDFLKQELHRLTGSAGTFGLEKVSSASLQLEAFLRTAFTSSTLSPENKELLHHLYEQLSLEVRSTSLCEYVGASTRPSSNVQDDIFSSKRKRIVIIEDDQLLAEHYHALLTEHDYDVSIYNESPLISEDSDCCRTMPDLFLVDMVLGKDKNAGAEFIKQLQKTATILPPIIFASVRDDFDARLSAVRAGGSRYLVKPFSDQELITSVKSLTEKETPPYRVLIIEDEKEIADHFVITMENAGIIAEAVYNPFEAIDKVKHFQPELIMMDIHMPGCNGLELATMIRHQEHYSKLPIVFLSADYGLQSRLSAMSIGVDDFIPKGIEPYQIIASVKSRLNKARLINSLTDNLTNEREKAEKANRSKSQFLSYISHELKTPLNVILGYCDLFRQDNLSPEQLEMVSEIQNCGEMQLELIYDLLDLNMIEEGKVSLEPRLLQLNELITNVLSIIKGQSHRFYIEFEIDMADNLLITTDERRLRQILLNLLSNAVKYNKQKGRVKITAFKADDDTLTLSIADTGRGISEHSMEKLFTPFERLEAEKTDIEGTGLGLGITKSLIELMGGTITADSTLGEGSTFTITLPAMSGASTNE
ncbi:MAG: response regulator [Gammaproteobacteria bacterium]|nr:response regulator [Gammaproteobacteria bacterium]